MKSRRFRSGLALFARQLALVAGAILAYFGVRGLTEGDLETARRHAQQLIDLERSIGLDLEATVQRLPLDHAWILTGANWVYIWLHWPVLIGTLIWLLIRHRPAYFELRNAMFISGAIGLVIFATWPVVPPRLFGPDFVDTVTQHSTSYRLLQPSALVNKYAAMPSFHVGWNVLAALTWWRFGHGRLWRFAAVLMPVAMAWATVATANHWLADVFAGAGLALVGLLVERWRVHRFGQLTTARVGAWVSALRPRRRPDGCPVGRPTSGTTTTRHPASPSW